MSGTEPAQRGVSARVDLDGEPLPFCDRCDSGARWLVCNLEGPSLGPVNRWYACGRHLHRVLDEGDWDVDSVHLYDMTGAKS